MRLPPAHLSMVLGSLWMAAWPPGVSGLPPVLCHQQTYFGVLSVHSSPSLMKILKKTEPNTVPWLVARLITSFQWHLVPPTTTLWAQIFGQFFSPTVCTSNPNINSFSLRHLWGSVKGITAVMVNDIHYFLFSDFFSLYTVVCAGYNLLSCCVRWNSQSCSNSSQAVYSPHLLNLLKCIHSPTHPVLDLCMFP